MSASLRSKILYHINGAMQASARHDTHALLSHIATLAELTIDQPRYAGHVTYLRALAAKAKAQTETFRALAAQALEELTSFGDMRATAQVVLNMGRNPSHPQQSLAYAVQAQRMFETCADLIGISNAMQNVGALLAQLGQYKEGQETLEQALEIKRQNNDMIGAATVLLNIASCALFTGNYTVGVLRAAEAVASIERIMAAPAREQVDLVWQTHGWERVPVDCRSLLATAYNNLTLRINSAYYRHGLHA